ncbi:MAG: response regulator, partial [Erythrobacteraceae bacterium]|nr:response regulator [Erythrobacteraceae bacterium]
MTVTNAPHILLAEDEEALRTYLERALTNAGYRVSAV